MKPTVLCKNYKIYLDLKRAIKIPVLLFIETICEFNFSLISYLNLAVFDKNSGSKSNITAHFIGKNF